MPAGWEGMLRLQRAPGWTDGGAVGTNGVFALAESVSLDYGAQDLSRDNKIVGLRFSPFVQYYTAGHKIYPRGEITQEMDSVSMAMLFAGLFQSGGQTGTTGSIYTFSPLNRGLNWGSGFAIGTFPYCINCDSFFQTQTTGANGIRYFQGIVDRVTISARAGEDVRVTPSFKFKTASYFTYAQDFAPGTNGTIIGEVFTDAGVSATFLVGGVNLIPQLNMSEITIEFDNSSADVALIGGTIYAKYPFLGRFKANVSITAELPAFNLASFVPGLVGTFSIRFTPLSGNSSVVISSIADIIKPYNIPISSGDSIVEITLPIELMRPIATVTLQGVGTTFIGL